MTYCDGKVMQTDINALDDYDNKLMDARTVAFISLVWSENVRSYTSRSFQNPVWHNFFGNSNMQKAIILAQLALYIAVLAPFFSDKILGLRGVNVGLWGWGVALVGPVGCVILCELCKLITAAQSRAYQEKLALRRAEQEEVTVSQSFLQKSSKHVNGALAPAPTLLTSSKSSDRIAAGLDKVQRWA